jgi:oligoribonuclease
MKLLAFINQHFEPHDKIPICGNSVSNDQRFIKKHLTQVYNRLHYRIIDVSSFKEIFKNKFNKLFPKKNTHQALEDIHESIEELKYYLSFVKLP